MVISEGIKGPKTQEEQSKWLQYQLRNWFSYLLWVELTEAWPSRSDVLEPGLASGPVSPKPVAKSLKIHGDRGGPYRKVPWFQEVLSPLIEERTIPFPVSF